MYDTLLLLIHSFNTYKNKCDKNIKIKISCKKREISILKIH